MTPSSLVIVTDRGGLKAYRVNETPTRGPSLQLVQAFNITDAHGRLIDKVSDQAGRFPVSDVAGAHHGAASIAERTRLDVETDRRILKELADQITKIVSQNGKEGWSFAAPAEIHSAIVELLPSGGSRSDRRTREIGFAKSGTGETHFAVSLVAANLKRNVIRAILERDLPDCSPRINLRRGLAQGPPTSSIFFCVSSTSANSVVSNQICNCLLKSRTGVWKNLT